MTKESNNSIEEYKEVGANMRQYVGLRFAQMTVFFAMTGGLIGAIYHIDKINVSSSLFKLVGLMVTGAFWVMEQRAVDCWDHYRQRAVALEESLKFKQICTRPTSGIISATNAVRVVYGTACAFWLYLLFFKCSL